MGSIGVGELVVIGIVCVGGLFAVAALAFFAVWVARGAGKKQ